MITQEHIDKSISFEAYYQLSEQLANEGKTTGEDQSEAMINYSKLNFSRMKRILKTTQPSEEVIKTVDCLNDKLTWVVLTESWCGDAAQNLPVFAKMAEANPNITIRILMRDENLDLMDQYLTNGGRSIPKLICVDESLNVLGTWGPRPKELQDWLKREKENPTMDLADLKKEFQIWYTKDKGQTVQKEMIGLLQSWLQKECMSLDH